MILYSLPGSALLRSVAEGIVRDAETAPFPVDFVSGADLFIRRDQFNRAGGFDEKYFAYYEEVDLAQQLHRNGCRSAIVPAARIQHLEGKSFKNPAQRKKLMFESSLYYLAKFRTSPRLFKLYCSLNEVKYRLYQLCNPAAGTPALREMVSAAQSYRRAS
jgi:GT2 family glycosyltransferase